MMKLHFFNLAGRREIPVPDFEKKISAGLLLEFLYDLRDWMQDTPLVERSIQKEDDVLYILFRGAAFAEDDFWQTYGAVMAALSARWRVDVFGVSDPSQETVQLSLEEEKGRFLAVQRTLSGQTAENIQSLCLRIHCASSVEAQQLQALLAAADWKRGILVADWKYREFMEKEDLSPLWQDTCFCYGSLSGKASCRKCLNTLNFAQQTGLWTGFLKNGFDYPEFEWLYHEITSRTLENRIEWELSMYTVLQKLGYSLEVSERRYELYDGNGRRRFFNFDSSLYSERVFLKMLFPVNI